MNNIDQRILVLVLIINNILYTWSHYVDPKHYAQLYGNRLIPDDVPARRYTGNTGFPMYEQQLRDYERNAKVHMEARNEQIKQYKEYNTRYTETAHENVNTMTASTEHLDKDKEKSDDKEPKKVPDKTSRTLILRDSLGFPLNPQVEEDRSAKIVSRSHIKTAEGLIAGRNRKYEGMW